MNGAVIPNTPHSPSVCTMLNEIVQYLKFFMFFPVVNVNDVSVIMMTSSSKFGVIS